MSYQKIMKTFNNNGANRLPSSYGTGNRHSIQLSYGRIDLDYTSGRGAFIKSDYVSYLTIQALIKLFNYL